MAGWRKLGLIAGGGDLPVLLAEHCAESGTPYFVARISPFASSALDQHPGVTLGLGLMGTRMAALRDAGCDALVMIGQVPRPELASLELDDGAKAMLPAILGALPQGDDALLRTILEEHERAGFNVLGAEAVMGDLLARPGAWGAVTPNAAHRKDVVKAARIAAAMGGFDIAQGAVVADGHVLAVEAAEGTDQMLKRVASLSPALRGTAAARRGVLVKRPKPIQDLRIDMPVVGVATIEGAAAAGLAGVAVEAGGALVVRRDEVIAAADRAGMFVYGFAPDEVSGA